MLNLIFILMIIMAIATVQTQILRHSVIYLATFSLLCSVAYLLYQAPDVAIAEAVIGCTLSTVLYLVALKKYTIFRVYYCNHTKNLDTTSYANASKNTLVSTLQAYLLKIELELDLINTSRTIEDIEKSNPFDIIIRQDDVGITILGAESNYHYEGLKKYINAYFIDDPSMSISFEYILESKEGASL